MPAHAKMPAPVQAAAPTARDRGTAESMPSNAMRQAQVQGDAGDERENLDDLFDAIDHAYTYLIDERIVGVEELGRDAHLEDPPPLWAQIAASVSLVALNAVTAGLGTTIAGQLVSRDARVVHDILKTAIKDGTASGVKLLIGNTSRPVGGDVAEAFFRAQGDALRLATADFQHAFVTEGRAAIRRAEDPVASAEELLRALRNDTTRSTAMPAQRDQTLSSWCNFQARCRYGTHGEGGPAAGVDLSKDVKRSTGVLELKVQMSQRRTDYEVVGARIGGLNEPLREELDRRPLAELGISVMVEGELDPLPWWAPEAAPLGTVSFGENEAGTRWSGNSPEGDAWLARYGTDTSVVSPDSAASASDSADVARGVARVLDRDLAPKRVTELGVKLRG